MNKHRDYKVDLHIHTIGNAHAYSTVEENINRALAKNMSLIALTPHGPAMADSVHWYSIRNITVLPEEIEGMRVLRGVEANIMNEEGEIDINPILYSMLDVIMAGFHPVETYGEHKDIAKNTKAAIRMMERGYVDIMVHPGNPQYPIDLEELAAAAKKYNVALEFNDSSLCHSRAGSAPICDKLMSICAANGNTIIVGSDSHVSYSIGEFAHVYEMLDKYNYDESLILNTSREKIETFLANRKKTRNPKFEQKHAWKNEWVELKNI